MEKLQEEERGSNLEYYMYMFNTFSIWYQKLWVKRWKSRQASEKEKKKLEFEQFTAR